MIASRLAILATTRKTAHYLVLRPVVRLRPPIARNFATKKEKDEDEEASAGLFAAKSKDISLRESKMIFGIEDASQMNVDHIKKKWLLLKKNNDPSKGGSMYLLQKIINAKKRLARHLQVDVSEFAGADLEAEEKKTPDTEQAAGQEEPAAEKKAEPQSKQ